VHIKLSYNTVS